MLILASTSPRRKELIKKITKDFIVVKPNIRERSYHFSVDEYATKLAELKAKAVQKLYPKQAILACDTVVIFHQQIINKPKNKEDARQILKKLSGHQHIVLSGYCYLSPKHSIIRSVKTKVQFHRLSDKLINDYVNSKLPMGKAGAYGIQDGYRLVKKISGSYDNVMGLPTEDIIEQIKEKKESIEKEIEIKALVNKKEYARFIKRFKKQANKPYQQINYYLDNKKQLLADGIVLRIRKKKGRYQLTLKTPIKDGVLETSQIITLAEFSSIKKTKELPNGLVKHYLITHGYKIKKFEIVTSLITKRIDIPYQNGLLSLDENTYNHHLDYEIEFEHHSKKEAEKIIKKLFAELNIIYRENKQSKVMRAFATL